jgi:hypothetical protein
MNRTLQRWIVALSCIGLTFLSPSVQPADACGGTPITDVGELLVPLRTMVADLLQDDFEGFDLEDFRFLRPFELAGRDPEGLFAIARDTVSEDAPQSGGEVDLKPFLGALEQGKLDDAKRAAEAVVKRVLDLPASWASAQAGALQRAVEFLELYPSLAGVEPALLAHFFVARDAKPDALPPQLRMAQQVRDTARAELPPLLTANPKHPRAPSIELVRIAERVHHDLPDGWPGQLDVGKQVWSALEHEYDTWLKTHTTHPLSDLARLSKLRVLYLQGDAKRAWDLLLDMYPRHPLRVAWEMRHILRAGLKPDHIALSKLKDPVLVTALLRESTPLTPTQWAELWQRSEQEPRAAWAGNLQERLFVQAIRLGSEGTPVPQLPAAARRAPQRWAELHAAALLAAHRDQDALAQAKLLEVKDDRIAAKLLAHAYLRQCDWAQAAAATQHLGQESLRYLLEVLASDAALEALSRGNTKDKLALPAQRARALRLLQTDQWQAAADLWPSDSAAAEAKARREATKLAADTSAAGHLRFAKWLRGAQGALLFPDTDRAYSRGLKQRLDALNGGPEADTQHTPQGLPEACAMHEREQLSYVLLRGGRRERAFEQYALALDQLDPSSPDAKTTLKEADALYNTIINWDSSWSKSFEPLLAGSSAARQLRDAGKRIRAARRPKGHK